MANVLRRFQVMGLLAVLLCSCEGEPVPPVQSDSNPQVVSAVEPSTTQVTFFVPGVTEKLGLY